MKKLPCKEENSKKIGKEIRKNQEIMLQQMDYLTKTKGKTSKKRDKIKKDNLKRYEKNKKLWKQYRKSLMPEKKPPKKRKKKKKK